LLNLAAVRTDDLTGLALLTRLLPMIPLELVTGDLGLLNIVDCVIFDARLLKTARIKDLTIVAIALNSYEASR